MRHIILGAMALGAATIIADGARAAGGAHVIDDAAVETPGTCHVENWVSVVSHDGGLLNAGPACTRKTWPTIEIGGFASHAWTRGTDDTIVGVTPKFVLRSEDTGVGVGIATSVGYGIDRHRVETASMIVPVTIPASDVVRLNLNGGWQWLRVGDAHSLFGGAQAEIALAATLSLMVEGFARDSGKAGGQTGMRWTIANGAIDLDLLAGRYLDGVTPTAITFGITLRR